VMIASVEADALTALRRNPRRFGARAFQRSTLRLRFALGARDRSDVSWLEEPVRPFDVDGYRRVHAMTAVPLAAGDSLVGAVGFAAAVYTVRRWCAA
jgi:L-alanine-DL-glutamate epimerase-like enolase superfamily enzyme